MNLCIKNKIFRRVYQQSQNVLNKKYNTLSYPVKHHKVANAQIQITSDIHTESYKENEIQLKRWVKPMAPNLAILGDLGVISILEHRKKVDNFLSECNKAFDKTFYISGNHEYYNASNSKMTICEINMIIEELVGKYKNVYFLNNKKHELNDYLILGSTLWTKISDKTRDEIQNKLADYMNIYDDIDKLITTYGMDYIHNKNLLWLIENIVNNPNKKIIIMTHHLPSFDLIAEKYRTDKFRNLNSAFATDLNVILFKFSNIKYWICGHSHDSMEITINQCKCIINPYGYKKTKNNNYKNNFVINI